MYLVIILIIHRYIWKYWLEIRTIILNNYVYEIQDINPPPPPEIAPAPLETVRQRIAVKCRRAEILSNLAVPINSYHTPFPLKKNDL